MDDEVAGLDVVEGGTGADDAGFLDRGTASRAGCAVATEELARGEDGELGDGEGEGGNQLADDRGEAEIALEIFSGKLGEAFEFPFGGEHDSDVPCLTLPFVELFEKGLAAELVEDEVAGVEGAERGGVGG